jgi:hypothetical protein
MAVRIGIVVGCGEISNAGGDGIYSITGSGVAIGLGL